MIVIIFYFEKVDRFLTENSFTSEINTRKTQNQNSCEFVDCTRVLL